MSSIETARNNARMVRTALTRETWESINEAWMALKRMLGGPIDERDLPKVLDAIKRETALIRGTFFGTMLRNEIFDFSQIGTFVERADNTARILDVKYYVLLPSISWVGSSLDNYQWESILRSVSRAPLLPLGLRGGLPADQHRRLSDPQSPHAALARLLLPQHRRAACAISREEYGVRLPCHETVEETLARLEGRLDQGHFRLRPARIPRRLHPRQQPAGRRGRRRTTAFIADRMRLKISHRTDYRYDAPVAMRCSGCG